MGSFHLWWYSASGQASGPATGVQTRTVTFTVTRSGVPGTLTVWAPRRAGTTGPHHVEQVFSATSNSEGVLRFLDVPTQSEVILDVPGAGFTKIRKKRAIIPAGTAALALETVLP